MTDLLEKLRTSKKNLFVGIAGPGTGKSYTFKRIVDSEEYRGKKILILSFINKLVDDLKLDFKDFTNVTVLTLHAFAKQKLPNIDLEPDLDKIISEDYCFLENKQVDFAEKFYENHLDQEESIFYKNRKGYYKYENELYSFNSAIYALNKYFEKYEDKIPTEYDLVLIDEFQDFNKLECELIRILNTKSKVIVVGDDDQSLYAFKKARPEHIRDLYNAEHCESFSLDYCRRCTRVIVIAVNQLIDNAKKEGLLKGRLDKKFLYPEENNDAKNIISDINSKIDFLSAVEGDLLIYKLAEKIKKDLGGENKRILILAPGYYKHTLFEGLTKKGFVVIDFELFSGENKNKFSHKSLINIFETLSKRKTDNLSLRKVLSIYLDAERLKEILLATNTDTKKIWNHLSVDEKAAIESDITLFKKIKKGEEDLKDSELLRFNKIFNLKNILSKLITGFDSVKRKPIEVEITTTTSSKGLSADLVYYLGIDDNLILDKDTKKLSNSKTCEFLVGITRAKEKLTLISMKDKNPQILKFLDATIINTIE